MSFLSLIAKQMQPAFNILQPFTLMVNIIISGFTSMAKDVWVIWRLYLLHIRCNLMDVCGRPHCSRRYHWIQHESKIVVSQLGKAAFLMRRCCRLCPTQGRLWGDALKQNHENIVSCSEGKSPETKTLFKMLRLRCSSLSPLPFAFCLFSLTSFCVSSQCCFALPGAERNKLYPYDERKEIYPLWITARRWPLSSLCPLRQKDRGREKKTEGSR